MSPAAANNQPCPASLSSNKRYTHALLLLLTLTISLIACRPAPPVVKIGLVGPFEGQHRAIGYDAIYSARLAVRQINESGGIGEYRLALVALDDSGDPELAAQTAASLTVDPDIIAVIGHWLPDSTAAAEPIYRTANLSFIPAGSPPFLTTEPQDLPADFLADYAAITPFDEVAGPYAAPAYDAIYLIIKAMEETVQNGRPINRQTITDTLQNIRYEGLIGEVYQP